MENGRPCVNFVFAMFRENVDSFGHSKTWRSLTIRWAIPRLATSNMRMVAWRRSKMNHRSRATRRSTDGMLGCLIFSVTSNNLIGSFVLPHTPNGHAGLPVLNRPPPLVAAARAPQR